MKKNLLVVVLSFTLVAPVLTSQFDLKYLLHEKAVINHSLPKT